MQAGRIGGRANEYDHASHHEVSNMIQKDNRRDPVEIVAAVGGVTLRFHNRSRALEVWCHLASQAGWDVQVLQEFVGTTADERLALVGIEPLKYLIKYAPRVRRSLVDDSGEEVETRTVFAHAAWAEPYIEEVFHEEA